MKPAKLIREDEESKTVQLVDDDGQPYEVKTYYYHCDHGFMAYQRRVTDPAATDLKCPLTGCDRYLVPGRAPKREGLLIKGND